MRCFIAINFPQEIKDSLEILTGDLEKKNRAAKIKWTEGKNLHLTLHFLDEIDESRAAMVEDELQKIAAEYSKYAAALAELGAFPDAQNPRVIYIGVKSNEMVEKIQKKLGYDLRQIGFNIDLRPYEAHVTLGRVKFGPAKFDVESPTGKFQIKSIELMKSTLTPSGPIYEIIKSVELR